MQWHFWESEGHFWAKANVGGKTSISHTRSEGSKTWYGVHTGVESRGNSLNLKRITWLEGPETGFRQDFESPGIFLFQFSRFGLIEKSLGPWTHTHAHTHAHTFHFNGHFSRWTWVSGLPPNNSPSQFIPGLRILLWQAYTFHVILNTIPPGLFRASSL